MVAGSIPDGHWNFLFRPHYGPGVYSASNRNQYQEYFPREGKGGQCVGLTLPHARADCHEIWELQSPGPSGPVQGLLYFLQNQTTVDTHSKLRLSLVGSRPEMNTGLQEVGTREQSKQVKSFQVATSKYVTRGGRVERNWSYIRNYHSKLKYNFLMSEFNYTSCIAHMSGYRPNSLCLTLSDWLANILTPQ
jgi:hypothetical protein